MLRPLIKYFVSVIGLFAPAWAQQPLVEAQVTAGYSDNYLQTEEKQASAVVQTDVRLNAGIQWRSFDVTAHGQLSTIDYKENSQAQFNTSSIGTQLVWKPTNQQNLNVKIGSSDTEQAPWQGIRRDSYQANLATDHPLQIDETKVSYSALNYSYKTAGEQGLVFSAGFTNNDKSYAATDTLALQNNKSTNAMDTSLGYQWRAGRHVFLQYKQLKSEFADFANRDNNSKIYALGLAWQATAITGFTLGRGQEVRTIESTSEENTSNYWSLQASWAPRSYSVFSLSSTQRQQSSEYQGQLLQLSKSYSLTWRHTWSNGINSQLGISQQKLSQVAVKRHEDQTSASLALSYKFAANWQSSLSYSYTDHADSLNRRNYQQNSVQFSIKYALGGNS